MQAFQCDLKSLKPIQTPQLATRFRCMQTFWLLIRPFQVSFCLIWPWKFSAASQGEKRPPDSKAGIETLHKEEGQAFLYIFHSCTRFSFSLSFTHCRELQGNQTRVLWMNFLCLARWKWKEPWVKILLILYEDEECFPTDNHFVVSRSLTFMSFLFVGFYSWRNTTKGSWFMQSLCAELDENGKKYDLLTLLTFVSQRVAFDFESNTPDTPTMHQQKQIPCTTTMLTRILRFNDKMC